MGNINRTNGQVSTVIQVIEEIAFQTNILALNAAVEGARAGQKGATGADAARHTAALIEESIARFQGNGGGREQTAGSTVQGSGGAEDLAAQARNLYAVADRVRQLSPDAAPDMRRERISVR
jgi:methyl-accepting chemotaxis protein